MQILNHPRIHPRLHLPCHSLSSSVAISPLSLLPRLSTLSLSPRCPISTIIRMGGGPRTFPGGVSKWQWKRMQAKKAKQLLKARLSRERQIYEMRKRGELKAAIADLERPWDVVERVAPKSALFSVGADEQLKVLADRFQKPGGFDLWSEDDGPQLFETPDGLPTARFFPKGVVHSVKPYGLFGDGGRGEEDEDEDEGTSVDGSLDGVGLRNRPRQNEIGRNSSRGSQSVRLGSWKNGGDNEKSDIKDSGVNLNGRNAGSLTPTKLRSGFRNSGNVGGFVSEVGSRNRRGGRNGMNSSSRTQGAKLGNASFAREREDSSNGSSNFSGSNPLNGGNSRRDHRWSNNPRGGGTRVDGNGPKLKDMGGTQATNLNMRSNGRQWSSGIGNLGRCKRSYSEDVYDMSLQRNGSYGFRAREEDARLGSEL